MPDYAFQGSIDKLEIARGYDGLLRGAPDPVLLFGVYVTDGSTVRLLGRSLHRFHAPSPFPSEVTTAEPGLPCCAVNTGVPFAFVALAVALEEDGGVDVQRMYGALERHGSLSVWSTDHSQVEPVALAGLRDLWRAPCAVELAIEGSAAAGTCRSDKWIGAVCWAMSPRPGAPVSAYRLPFLASNGRNDWTALVSIAH